MKSKFTIEELKKLSLEEIKETLNPHVEKDLEYGWFNEDVTCFVTDKDYTGLYSYLTDTDYEV